MQTQWLTKAEVGNFLFPVAVDRSNEDVHFWHRLQRARPALLSDRLMLIIPPRRMYSATKEDTDMQQTVQRRQWPVQVVHLRFVFVFFLFFSPTRQKKKKKDDVLKTSETSDNRFKVYVTTKHRKNKDITALA